MIVAMSGLFSKQNVNGVFIPTALLILGVAIVKAEWLPYAATVAALVGGLKIVLSTPEGQTKAAELKAQANSTAAAAAAIAKESVASTPAVALNPTEFQDFPVTKITKVSHNVGIYRFALPNPTDTLGLPIGQHISLAAVIEGAKTNPVVRLYTPISSDDEKGYVDFMIKSYPQGNISRHMTTLKVGDTMKVRGPKGAMVYEPNMVRHIGMIAGGTGITPMLQIARAIAKQRPSKGGSDTTKVDLIFANVNPDDILLKAELDELATSDTDFNVHYVLNNPPEGWTGGVGFVTADMIKKWLPAPAADIKILLCGPPPMIKALRAATESLGYDKANLVSKLKDQVFCF